MRKHFLRLSQLQELSELENNCYARIVALDANLPHVTACPPPVPEILPHSTKHEVTTQGQMQDEPSSSNVFAAGQLEVNDQVHGQGNSSFADHGFPDMTSE